LGAIAIPERAGGFTVRVAFFEPLSVAVRVTAVIVLTAVVLTVNVALVPPDATVTLAGTAATDGLLLARVTVLPPEGAGPLSVIVPVTAIPPTTAVGFTVSAVTETGGAQGVAEKDNV